ncbi:MAG: TonB family protein [Candidatus Omnitrophota bacterium]
MKKILNIAFSLFFIISVGYSHSSGEEPLKKDGVITIYSGEIKVIKVDTPTKVAINNPSIVDVTSIAKDEMTILGKTRGTTSLAWWDARGAHTSQVEVLLENMGPVKERIDNILEEMDLKTVFTRGMDSEGTVLLLGNLKTPQDIERINVALGSLKERIINLVQVREEEAVVGIDVQVLELTKDATDTLGFTWPGSITLTEVGSPGIAAVGTKWSTLFKVLNLSRGAFAWTLDALVQEGKARILSQPRLSCQSGKEAELMVGGEKPILTTQTVSGGGTGTEVEYKEYGIKLKIKPTVTDGKRIKLALSVEVSEVETAVTIGGANTTALAYPLKKRNTSTELYLDDGQTMAIGGLKKQKSEEDIRKTPFLGDVPILGLFFRKRTTETGGGQGERGDVELFITLTPTIIKEAAEEVNPEAAPDAKKEETAKDKEKAGVSSTVGEGAKKEETAAQPQVAISPVSEYVHGVSQLIRHNIVYPWAAEAANMEGSLKLALHVYYTGQLIDVQVKEPSGYALFDENAVSTVKRIAPYPPFPPEIKQRELRIDLPIVYKSK